MVNITLVTNSFILNAYTWHIYTRLITENEKALWFSVLVVPFVMLMCAYVLVKSSYFGNVYYLYCQISLGGKKTLSVFIR